MLKVLDLIIITMIFYYYQHCVTIIDAYRSELKYETKQFIKTIYYNYKQVIDKSK